MAVSLILTAFSPAFRWGLIEAGTFRKPSYTLHGGFPRHFAGASLKPASKSCSTVRSARFPRHFAGASLKLRSFFVPSVGTSVFSPAFRWGLIEARCCSILFRPVLSFSPAFRWGLIEAQIPNNIVRKQERRFPRHFAGASLKLDSQPAGLPPAVRFPRHFAGASLKPGTEQSPAGERGGFPRHFAGASLKPHPRARRCRFDGPFSPAFRWGLIEATVTSPPRSPESEVFPGISLGPH